MVGSRELIRIIEADGWVHVGTVGDHYQFKHPTKKGKVTIPHPNKDLKIWVVKNILLQAGLTSESLKTGKGKKT